MSFWLVMRQRGEGCDYTIGCGTKVVTLNAETGPDAINEAERILAEDDLGYLDSKGERCVESAAVVDVVLQFPVSAMIRDRDKSVHAARVAREEAKERAELERLQRKYSR